MSRPWVWPSGRPFRVLKIVFCGKKVLSSSSEEPQKTRNKKRCTFTVACVNENNQSDDNYSLPPTASPTPGFQPPSSHLVE